MSQPASRFFLSWITSRSSSAWHLSTFPTHCVHCYSPHQRHRGTHRHMQPLIPYPHTPKRFLLVICSQQQSSDTQLVGVFRALIFLYRQSSLYENRSRSEYTETPPSKLPRTRPYWAYIRSNIKNLYRSCISYIPSAASTASPTPTSFSCLPYSHIPCNGLPTLLMLLLNKLTKIFYMKFFLSPVVVCADILTTFSLCLQICILFLNSICSSCYIPRHSAFSCQKFFRYPFRKLGKGVERTGLHFYKRQIPFCISSKEKTCPFKPLFLLKFHTGREKRSVSNIAKLPVHN